MRRSAAIAAFAVLGTAVGAPLGWWVSDRLEENDAFCVTCHLPSGAPLHEHKLADFGARPALSLAAAHAAAGNAARADGSFRCFDCHSGTGFAGRARVKLLTLRDGLLYLSGRFEEPRLMTWPLRDEDCRKCHARFASASASRDAWETPAFHALSVHNRELGVSCVTCHLVHDRGGLADRDFLHPEPVRAQCARCHAEFGEGEP